MENKESINMVKQEPYFTHGCDSKGRRFTISAKAIEIFGGFNIEYGIVVCGYNDQFSKKYGREHSIDPVNKLIFLPEKMIPNIQNDQYSQQRILKNLHKLRREAERSAITFLIKYRYKNNTNDHLLNLRKKGIL